MNTKFTSFCPGKVVRQILHAYPKSFTVAQRLSWLGEVKGAIERGDEKQNLSVLRGVCRVLGFEIRKSSKPNIMGITTYYAGIPQWESIDGCVCGNGCSLERNSLTGEFRSSSCNYEQITELVFEPN